jgi:hypothetical protein
MRRTHAILGGATLVVLSALVACAGSDEDPSIQPSKDPPSPLGDPPADGGLSTDAEPPAVPSCSTAGWCITKLPDDDLELKDIWPFESRAFAVAESPTLGVKVLEWDEATKIWSYIDDNAQNTFELDSYAGKLWAPNENEVYFSAAPGLIVHGKRSAPSTPWSWERTRLDDLGNDHPEHDHGRVSYPNREGLFRDATALGVWGTSANDVYAWYGNTIFHWKADDAGVPGWVAEHTAADVDNPNDDLFVFGAAGSSADDVWFVGGHGRTNDFGIFRCPVVIHRTASGYQRVVDSVIDETDMYSHFENVCQPKDGLLAFSELVGNDLVPRTNAGWLTNVESVGAGRIAGILGENQFAFVEPVDPGDGGVGGVARINRVTAQVPRKILPSLVNAVWTHGNETWISGWGLVLRTPTDPTRWSKGFGLLSKDEAQELGVDAPTYTFSSTAINGAPLDKPLTQVRGTSSSNLWAIGLQYALHKTTP